MRLLLIRHAESSNNALAQSHEYNEYMQKRTADPVITELGVKQAELLAQHLAGNGNPPPDAPPGGKGAYGITHVYCSAMLRTLQTIAPAARLMGLNPRIWIDIHEHGGMFVGNPRTGDNLVFDPGLTREAIQRDYPEFEIPEAVTDKGWWTGGYEDMPSCYARAIRVARELRRRAAQEAKEEVQSVVALVSHGTFMDALIKALFNQVPASEHYYFHYNTAITRIDFTENGTLFMRYHNRTIHLPDDHLSQ